MKQKEIKSASKLRLIDFIRYYGQGATEPFNFELAGNVKNGENFVHRMRVELSRMRSILRARGVAPSSFKLMLVDIKLIQPFPPRVLVTLEKTNNVLEASEDVKEIFSLLSDGALITKGV